MELDQRLFRNYIEHKSEGLVGGIEQGMQTGLFDWEQCENEPESVRTYVHEIILSLATIHCEVGIHVSAYADVELTYHTVLSLYGTGLHSVSITGGASATSTSATHCGGDTEDL